MSTNTNKKNIGGDKNDSFFRYKRDTIEVKVVNKQGGMTQIINLDAIQKQLKVPKEFITSFYKQIKKKGHAMISPGVFRGSVKINVFEEILDAMIDKFVLCPKCRLPEWTGESCQACGHVKGQEVKEKRKLKITDEAPESITSMLETVSLSKKESKLVEKMKEWYAEREKRLKQGLSVSELDAKLDKAWKQRV